MILLLYQLSYTATRKVLVAYDAGKEGTRGGP